MLIRGTLRALIFAASFLTVAGLVRIVTEPVDPSLLSAKLADFARDKDAYDTLFVGTSNVYRHADPETFDAEMEQLGRPSRSYNLGCQGMAFVELDYALRQVFDMAPAKLQRIVIDLPIRWGTHEENFLSDRSVAWHDLRGTWVAAQLGLLSPLDRGDQWALLRAHATAFAWRLTNRGRGLALGRWFLFGSGASAEQLAGHERGFMPLLDDGSERALKRRQMLADRAPAYEQAVRDLKETGGGLTPFGPAEEEWVGRLLERIENAGRTPIFFVGPRLELSVPFLADDVNRGRYALLRFDDPGEFPTLYKARRRFDGYHLDEKGARLFTRSFARRLHERLASAGNS